MCVERVSRRYGTGVVAATFALRDVIWLPYMMAVQKTTVYLDEADYRQLKAIARSKGRTPAELVREAVAEYTARERPKRTPRSLGAGRSRTGDVAERAEELLNGFGNRR